MSDVGKITEIEPEDGLGWIELEAGADRVRFGGTACKGFVPAVGMRVRVLGTKPGYGGTIKATGLELIKDGSKGKRPAQPGAPRTSLHDWTALGVASDDLLLAVLGRSDVDDAFRADLASLMFEIRPSRADGVDCQNPWLTIVAMNGSGSAYGLYAHPTLTENGTAPWVFWEHEDDSLRYLNTTSSLFFAAHLVDAAAVVQDPALIERARRVLTVLGMTDTDAAGHGKGQLAPWLPPDDAVLRTVDDYLNESDGIEMERGLLAHAMRRKDEHAIAALKALYVAWSWTAPGYTT